MTTGARVRNDRGQGGRLRDEIVAAAMAIVDASDDPGVLTLRGIAREAGITAPSIYAHFGDVQAVADAVLEQSFAELDATVAEAMTAEPSPDGALVAGCLAYVRFGWDHRARYRFMFAGSGFAPDAVATFSRIATAVADCVAGGLSTSTDSRQDAFLTWVGMHGMAILETPERSELRRLGPLDRVALAETMVRRIAGL